MIINNYNIEGAKIVTQERKNYLTNSKYYRNNENGVTITWIMDLILSLILTLTAAKIDELNNYDLRMSVKIFATFGIVNLIALFIISPFMYISQRG